MLIPTKEECLKILKENNVPANVIAHCQKVYEVAMKVCDILEQRNITVNRDLAGAGALLHDIAKAMEGDHVISGYVLVRSLGYQDVARLISRHGLIHIDDEDLQPKTTEEKVVFYSDKRVIDNGVVSVEERFKYIKEKYKSPSIDKEYKFTKKIEEELLEGGDINIK